MKKLLALFAAALVLAGCHSGGTNQNSTDLRALNAVIDAEPLDILVEGDVKFAAVAPDTATSYANFSSGNKQLTVRSSTNQAVLFDKPVNFTSDSRSTLMVFGRRNSIATALLPDDTVSPSSGKARIRFIGLAADAGAVDVYITPTDISAGPAFVTGAVVGTATSAGEVTGGSYKIIVTSTGTQDVLFQSSTTFNFAAGSNYTISTVPSLGGKLVNVMILEPGLSGAVTTLTNPIARVKAANAISDSTAINFKADGATLLTAVPFTGVSSYVNTPSGSHALQIEASNVPGTNIASLTSNLGSARDYTLLATGTLAAPKLTLIADDNTPPSAGNVKIRFINATSSGTNVDALVNFAGQASGIAPASASAYYTIAANTNYTITFTSPGGVNSIATLSGVQLDAGNIYTVYVFGTLSSAQAKLVRDR